MYGARMDKLGDTFYKFALHLRQRLTEEQFAEALEEYGGDKVSIKSRHQLEGYTIQEDAEYPVTVTIRDLEKDALIEIKTCVLVFILLSVSLKFFNSKYLIGADGGKSTIRKLASIPFLGDSTTKRWIRMDAEVEFPSGMPIPNPRSLNSIDSASHGQILWCPVDNGLTRIGTYLPFVILECSSKAADS